MRPGADVSRRVLLHACRNGWQATELRYRGSGATTPLTMTIVLPDDLTAFEGTLSVSQLGRIRRPARCSSWGT